MNRSFMTRQNIHMIVGAGLAGLTAGYAFPGVPIVEAGAEGAARHRAVLRFRTDALGRLTGIPFRPVRVHKGVWSRGRFCAPDIQVANLYARKCLDRLAGDRSIWNVAPADRWVAPETLQEQMVEHLRARVHFDTKVAFEDWPESRNSSRGRAVLLNTGPMPAALGALDVSPTELPSFARAPIWTRRYRVNGADVHQTVYFPDHELATYRASITGDLLIVELRNDLSDADAERELAHVTRAMGLDEDSIDPIDSGEQRYGKIVPLPDDERRGWLARLTMEAGIYSLGRFATWRNVLLDDVVKDAEVIRRMLGSAGIATNFHALRAAAGPDAR